MAGEFDVALSAGKGALSGSSTGSTIGSLVPGVGPAIGAGVGAAVGGISSGIKANQASQASQGIQAQDPQELARLAEINRIRKSIGAGTDPLTQQKLKEAQQIGASTQSNIARVTGGNVGATVAGLTRAQRGTQAASNQAIAGAQQRLPFFENLGQQLRTRISQRALEVGLQRRDQALAEKAAAGKAASANIAGAMGVLGNQANTLPSQGFTGGFTGGGSPSLQQSPLPSTDQNPSQVGIDASQPPSLQTGFGVGNNLLPSGLGAEGQSPLGIANQGLNSPVQQVPLVAPGGQSAAVGNLAVNGNQSLIDQLATQIRGNPTGAPSAGQLGIMNQLGQ